MEYGQVTLLVDLNLMDGATTYENLELDKFKDSLYYLRKALHKLWPQLGVDGLTYVYHHFPTAADR